MTRRGLDTNILVYAHMVGCPQHSVVRARLQRELADPDVIIVLSPIVLHEFIHVVTDARWFDPPLTMAEAIAVTRSYLGASNVEVAPLTETALTQTLNEIERRGLGRKRIADTLVATSFRAAGATEILTCNPSDFASITGLSAVDPTG